MKKLNLASGICLNLASLAFGLSLLFTNVNQNGMVSNALDDVFGHGKTEIINTGKTPIRFKTWYSSVEDTLNGNGDIAKAAESEGAVLLKNENSALPLNVATDNVSLFGVTAYDPMYSLDGAGEVKINASRQQYLFDELKREGVNLNEELADWYHNDGKSYYRKDYINIYNNTSNQNNVNANINGAPWEVLPACKENGDTAIFVTGRMTNEGIDLLPKNVSGLGAKDNNYLAFTDNELSVLQGMKTLKEQGKLKKIIVLFNQANPVVEDLPEVLKNYGVDAAMWIGFPGSDGFGAVADLLVGKSSPSGGLSTTWFASREASPSTSYYASSSNVLIQEGVYLGYKYAETRYEDKLLNQGETQEFKYDEAVAYPFGYGLSYASFESKMVGVRLDKDPLKNYDLKGNKVKEDKLRKDGDDLIVTVKVRNTSEKVSAKEPVQVYLQKPYTATNKEHGVEKPSVELVGFGKTKKLAPGEEQTLEIAIDANKYFASFDITDNKYVVDNGDYYLSVARNSHEAINNILKKKGVSGTDTEYGAGNENNVYAYTVSDSYTQNYNYWTRGGAKVTNLFDHADPNKASGDKDNVTFMSRKNWKKTADEAKNQTVTVKGDMNKLSSVNGKRGDLSLVDSLYADSKASFKQEYPNYGQNLDSAGIAKIQLADMVGVEYQDLAGASEESKQKWEDFMDQLTWEDTVKLLSNGLRRTLEINSIGKPYTNDVNASNGISWMFDMSKEGGSGTSNVGFASHFDTLNRLQNPTGYPCEGIIASSFNKDLAYAVGQAIGEDGLWSGASGLYGFGLGLHRNAYHGRAGEYYSEDSYLSGVMGGYESKGAQSKGLYVYNKHFVLNDQETSRTSYNTWLTEQTMRETYIRPFEIAIEIGDAMNVMSAFNHVGSVWSGSDYNLMTLCLRNELGMRGFAVTDYFPSGGMSMSYGMMAGTDLPDGAESSSNISKFGPESGNYGYYAQACRQAAQRILYTVANSNAMNFIGVDTKVISYEPEWHKTRDGILISVYSLFGISCAFFVGTNAYYLVQKFSKKKEN